ncbi:glycerophosphodiester phosphodiesterase [Polycladomyces subterraneus]|uniref:Glycerophosphodiester phosphodiesterase n=1 Tax=Polycladomyces subterraneus TaxID=1016997 RepID=A0ABT8IL55_9BACL|nr:glycerophosphodiester phosphodiesterase [Polycladomyces subterraneus]MDN4593510.1 glycerophosphodiester phosphodiesterase [Polycladomyces subterraneus]
MKHWMHRLLAVVGVWTMVAALAIPTVLAADLTQVKQTGLLSPDRILNVGHRGASGHAPEHTIPSYELAQKMKADYIELDLQMTKDGHLICMHDETLDRTTNGTGYVKDHTLSEIKQLDAGSWFNEAYPQYAKPEYKGLKVPTLEEVLDHFGHSANYYIETKSPETYPGMEEKLLEALNRHHLIGPNAKPGQVIIQSFSPESLKLNPSIPLVQLLWHEQPARITDQELNHIHTYAIGVGPNFDKIDRAYIQKVRQHGLLIHPYTVNEQTDMNRLIDWGVTGMFTNFPDRLHEVLKDREGK